MLLTDHIKEDLKTALKSTQGERVGVLRLLIAEIQNKQKEKFGAKEQALADDDVSAVLWKEAKKRREAIELFKKGNRDDLVKKEEAELRIIEEYLPKQLSREEIAATVEKLMAAGNKDFNSLMRGATKELRGRADGRVVNEVVRKKLSNSE